MKYRIIWTNTARNDFHQIIDYLIEKWGKTSAYKFSSKVTKQLELISSLPQLYPKTEVRENIRKCIITEQVSLYYQDIKEDKEILVIRLFDNRRSLDKLEEALNNSDL